MTQESKSGKRIVSKSKYAKKQIERTVTATWGSCFVLIGAVCGTLALVCLACIPHYLSSQTLMEFCSFLVFAISLGMAMVRILRPGFAYIREAAQNDVVPLTRANTADLPATESLVRASSEPLQAQEAVLLRAAAQGQETPSEQLVRSSMGQE